MHLYGKMSWAREEMRLQIRPHCKKYCDIQREKEMIPLRSLCLFKVVDYIRDSFAWCYIDIVISEIFLLNVTRNDTDLTCVLFLFLLLL